MFNQEYFGLPLWVWFVIVAIIGFSVYQTCNTTCKPVVKTEVKEKFANETTLPEKPIIKIFNFNTEWCGWSRKFQPEWEAFMTYVKNPENNLTHVQAFDVKCDNEENKGICEEYQVPGYPYVIVEVNGARKTYENERTKDALIAYVSGL